jgi:hypothetical protein
MHLPARNAVGTAEITASHACINQVKREERRELSLNHNNLWSFTFLWEQKHGGDGTTPKKGGHFVMFLT